MKTITEILTEKLGNVFSKCGYEEKLGLVRISDRPDLCQFQCNGALSGAKKYQKSPNIIATEIVNDLKNDEDIKNINVVGSGFINIDMTDNFILNYTNKIFQDDTLGIPQVGKNQTIVLDYGGPNVAKPLHIGHLRAAIIGESIKRIANSVGAKTISDVHLGDWGLQIGLVIALLLEKYPQQNGLDFNIEIDELNEIYPLASKKSKEDETFKLKAQKITAELQNGNELYNYIWRKILESSVIDIKKTYKILNVDFDYWYGESNAEKYIDELIKILINKNLLQESQGAMVVEIALLDDKINMPPVIIKKSDDSNIYATTDLATIIQRQKDFNPNEIWYVVDNRQSLHFKQVFRCAYKAGLISESVKLEHLGFGTINGTDGKPYKTRDGGIMKLSDFYDNVYEAAHKRVLTSNFSNDLDKDDIARKITVATIKFGDLINYRIKDYIFDLDKFLATEGKTGTFLLYTVARINSILNKLNYREQNFIKINKIYTNIERELILKINLSNEVFVNAFEEKTPHIIAENAYQIASLFSKFYQDNYIINEVVLEKQTTWVQICLITKKALTKHLEVLGIETVEMM